MKYSLPWLIDLHARSETLDYLCFWGHQPRADGQVGDSCLSQWWEASFIVDQLPYPTAEHWMMAEKARHCGDEETLAKILAAKSPGAVKNLGRQVRNFDPASWDEVKYEIVKTGNLHKFSQQKALGDYLKHTAGCILVEASPLDQIWGIGLAEDHPHITDPNHWPGQNLLGFALMEVRDTLT